MTTHAPTPAAGPLPIAAPHSLGTRVLRGPNLWSPSAAVVCELRSEGAAAQDAVGALAARLGAALPTLVEAYGGEAALVRELSATDAVSQAVALAAAELQRLAGSAVAGGRVTQSGDAGVWVVAVEYEEESVGRASVRFAIELVEACVRGGPATAAALTDDLVHGLRSRLERDRPNPTTALLIAEARRRGIPVRREPGDPVVQLGLGARRRLIDGSLTDRTSAIGARIAADAGWAMRVLHRFEVPVPRGETARSADEAVELAEDLEYPVRMTTGGETGPFAPLATADAVRDAYAAAGCRSVTVERFAAGSEHRVLVVGGRVVAVTDAPSGGERRDRTDLLHPENAALCGFAADVLGLDVAEVEVVSPDVARPFRENAALVVAARANPDIAGYEGGAGPNVAAAVLDAMFRSSADARVPVVAVTGTNGKTTTTRLIAHLLRAGGLHVGYTGTDGVHFDGRMLAEGDLTGPAAADMVLANPRVEAAVLETARGGILRAGLGYQDCDVGVVLNVTPDHLGLAGIHTLEQLAAVKAVIARSVRAGGFAVLNADDPLVFAMRSPGTRALFTTASLDGQALVATHVESGGPAVSVEQGTFVLHRDGARAAIAAVVDVPLTVGGAAHFQVANVAAALLAAACAGAEVDALRRGVRTFGSSVASTPGRMNMLRLGGATVIVDYAHNAAAIGALFEFAGRMSATRRIAVVGAPGDRRDEDIRALGALTARLDLAILREHSHYNRGRAPGEISTLLADGHAAAGGRADQRLLMLDEPEAIAEMQRRLEPGDLVLLLAADSALAVATLRRAGAVDATANG